MSRVIPIAVCSLLAVAACQDRAPGGAPAKSAHLHVEIKVTEVGFQPAGVEVPAGKEVTLVFERKSANVCANALVIQKGDGTQLEQALTLNVPVEITTTFSPGGKPGFACDTLQGTIVVK
jgi:plastocyanin